jgi:hypothetical protein
MRTCAASALLGVTTVAAAHPGPRFWLGTESGRIVTYREASPGNFQPAQVFTQEMEEIIPNLWSTEFPGYEVRPGGNVDSGTVFGFRLAGPLLRFNLNTHQLDEMTVPGGERLAVADETEQTRITSAGVQDGFNFFAHVGAGDHAHLFYTLYGNGTSAGGGADGAYVLPLQLTSPSYARSDWYFLVLDKNASDHDVEQTQFLAQAMADALPGDANFDGTVNLQDFNRLAANFGSTGTWWKHGDFNFDGNVNLADFNLLAANFGQSAAPTSVPEPAGVCAVAGLMVASMARRRT